MFSDSESRTGGYETSKVISANTLIYKSEGKEGSRDSASTTCSGMRPELGKASANTLKGPGLAGGPELEPRASGLMNETSFGTGVTVEEGMGQTTRNYIDKEAILTKGVRIPPTHFCCRS